MASDFGKANEAYVANFGDKASLPIPPAKKLLIVTCMDARIEPAQQLGIKEGDAHIVRNAGGVVKDAIRSIVISQRLLGTREIAVFHHTDCGMTKFTSPQLRDILKSADPDDANVAKLADSIDFLEFPNEVDGVKHDVKFLQEHPLILKETTVTGWIYHADTGKVTQVV